MFMIEGEWSGYTSAQQRVCHREYLPKSQKSLVEAIQKIGYGIRFTDNTLLILRVRETPRRALPSIDGGYSNLIRKCAKAGVSSVAELESHEKSNSK